MDQKRANEEVLPFSEPSKISVSTQIMNGLQECMFSGGTESYLLLPSLCQKWRPALEKMPRDERVELVKTSSWVPVMLLDISLPDAEAISFDAAKQNALKAMSAQKGWSAEKADMFKLRMSAYYTPQDIGRPVFFFLYNWYSNSDKGYNTQQTAKRYTLKLQKAFGDATPVCFSIMIDAKAGTLVEPPLIDFVPSRFHAMDFICRTPKLMKEGKLT